MENATRTSGCRFDGIYALHIAANYWMMFIELVRV